MKIWSFTSNELPEKNLPFKWSSEIPTSCPVARSESLNQVIFTGRFANYTKADTWYPSWAEDGHLYSPWTDGTIGDMDFVWSGAAQNAKTGQAKIIGEDPMDLQIHNMGVYASSALPYQGRYPCGSLVHNEVWYYGTYALGQPNKEVQKNFGWYIQGPHTGFRYSTDFGKTWIESPHTPDRPLFPEPSRDELDLQNGKTGAFIKLGAPHFVDFGKNMENSPDGKAYLVGHGSLSPDEKPRVANNSWNCSDAIFMTRVTPGIENMNDISRYEFFSGYDENNIAVWSKDYADIQPIFEWNNNCGIVTMTYNKPLEKYLMCITDGHRDSTTRENYDTYILESDSITGPWRMVEYMKDFGPQAYFVNIPSKFISYDGKIMWICFSANYMYGDKRNQKDFLVHTNPKGSAYSLSLHEIQLDVE